MMQVLVATLFTFSFVSHCSCNKLSKAIIINVIDYGAAGDGLTDDSQVFLKAWRDVCMMKTGTATLKVPPGKTFLLNPLKFNGPCHSSSVHFQLGGNIVAPKSTKTWTQQERSKWIVFSTVDSLIVDGGGQIDGRGYVWWKSCDVTSCIRPTALFFDKCNNLHLSGTRHLNSARNHISIHDSNNVNILSVKIIAPQNSPNTDGIDISQSSNILIQNSIMATGDDCIAMNNGTSKININRVTCGPGHGISVGSLGEKRAYAVVEQVHVYNCIFKGSENGMRIKTWPGGSGYVRNITFEHITLKDTKNPIIIDQNYIDKLDGDHNQGSAVKISGVTYRDVHGTSDSKTSIILNCNAKVGCTNIIMDAINITLASSGSATQSSCSNAHGKAFSTSPYVSCLSK